MKVVSSVQHQGKQTLPVSTTSGAPINLPHGAAPSAPVNGDMWTTTSYLYVRLNGKSRALAHTSQWTAITQAEAEAGTATTARLITAQRMNQAIQALSPVKSVAGKTGVVTLTADDIEGLGYPLDDSYAGVSVTFDWLDNTRLNWQKHWSGANGTGTLLKQISYTWTGNLCTRETFTFPDKTFQVDYTYTGVKITGINITEV